jgi:hypothetical protein
VTTVNIPLITLTVGAHTAGPATLNGTWTTYLLTLDRTVTGGLNSVSSSTHIGFSVEHSTDAGVSWRVLATGGTLGGPPGDGSPGIGGDFSPPLAAGQVRVTVTVTGASVAVAGTLVVT